MNDEIKEILDYLKDENDYIEDFGISYKRIHIDNGDLKILLSYINNLQQENEKLKAQLTNTEWEYQNTRCKYEKQYKKGTTEEVIEDIEECFFNRENPSMIPIDSLDVCHIFGYIDYLKDYKSRCEKAIEYINNFKKYFLDRKPFVDTRHIDLEYLLNILQNGSENDEC